MSNGHDLSGSTDYYSARAVEERRLAMAAKDPNARAAHLEMAEKYSELAKAGGAAPVSAADGQLTA